MLIAKKDLHTGLGRVRYKDWLIMVATYTLSIFIRLVNNGRYCYIVEN